MNNPLVSILVPVYNVEAFLEKCLDSIVGQTYRDLQIVLVDDGSTDRSGAICDEFASKDNRIEVVHKPNGGVATARNELIKHIKGEYFLFVDADDWIEPEMVEHLLGVIQETDADIAVCGMVWDDAKPCDGPWETTTWDQNTTIREFVRHQKLSGSLCNKLTNVNLLHNERVRHGISFNTNVSFGEDALFCWQMLQGLKKMALTSRQLYHYRRNFSSISHRSYGPTRQSEDIVWETISRECADWWPQDASDASARRYVQNMWQLYYAAKAKSPKDAQISSLQKRIRKHLCLIRKSGLLNYKKLFFAFLTAYSYKLAKLMTN